MYNVLTAIKNNMLLQELKRLHIWGASTSFKPSADHPAGKALSGNCDGRADGGI